MILCLYKHSLFYIICLNLPLPGFPSIFPSIIIVMLLTILYYFVWNVLSTSFFYSRLSPIKHFFLLSYDCVTRSAFAIFNTLRQHHVLIAFIFHLSAFVIVHDSTSYNTHAIYTSVFLTFISIIAIVWLVVSYYLVIFLRNTCRYLLCHSTTIMINVWGTFPVPCDLDSEACITICIF